MANLGHRILQLTVTVGGAVVLTAGAQAQVFTDNTTAIPTSGSANNSSTENVDFGDVDRDGDWDAIFADGGDSGNDQNRIWINQGGLQAGTIGNFVDATSTRFPAIQQTGRDIEFVDFDNDGDIDIYTSNTSQVVNQTNRWWVNSGGIQAGTEGFYVDETSTRWVGIGGAGSSIPAASVLPGGGFIDWSCDCDFGDLDNDGDLDLVHSSYGGAFNGNVPTRIFLNDGTGLFAEFNPSGFQLSGNDIVNGNPGLWCEGTHSSNTTNATGLFCDIASSALDIDVGDIDGDFDLDILHGARQELPRMFQNRLEENGGTLGFRDVTGTAFPAGYSTGDGHYEQEMGDLDGDGDLDIYGLNWAATPGFNDITLRNTGNGVYDNRVVLSGSSSDDNEGDFLDYDLDGDLDLFVANFAGADKLYRNNNNGGASFDFTNVTSGNIPPYASFSPVSLDADAADVDNDGDYDVMVAADTFDRNVLLTNTTNPASGMDNHAPVIPNVEQAPARTAGPAPTVIRAHVYDNAPYYVTWYNPTRIDYTVNAGPVQSVDMRSSAGQIFRGEIPGNLVGNICYTIVSQDHYGQVGTSATLCYDSFGPSAYTDVCNGDGGVTPTCTPCPCGNDAPMGTIGGCLNPSGTSARLTGSGNPSAMADTMRFEMTGGVPSSFGILISGPSLSPNNPANPCFGLDSGTQAATLDGLRCVVGGTLRHGSRATNAVGEIGTSTAGWGPPNGPAGGLIAASGFTAGQTRHFQVTYRVLPNLGCMTSLNTSQAVSTMIQP